MARRLSLVRIHKRGGWAIWYAYGPFSWRVAFMLRRERRMGIDCANLGNIAAFHRRNWGGAR